MAEANPHLDLIPWKPTPTQVPEEWMKLAQELAQEAKGSQHAYVLKVKYDAQRVGNLLRSWGLPWDVVMAGYLWEYDKDEIRSYQLSDTESVIGHISHATTYFGNIRDDILPPLLTPPFEDLGGLLIAIAIYYEAFRTLRELSNNELLGRTLRSDIERIRRTLINITKRLGMWDVKREVEDTAEQLL